jgi:DNA-binding HxlR family transcriptional regulator
MILWHLFVEPLRYSTLEGRLAGVSQRALSQALAELAADRVIVRTADVWALTPLGEAMRPALTAMLARAVATCSAVAPLPRTARSADSATSEGAAPAASAKSSG